MDLERKLQSAVERYNELERQEQTLRQQLEAKHSERLQALGALTVLNELHLETQSIAAGALNNGTGGVGEEVSDAR